MSVIYQLDDCTLIQHGGDAESYTENGVEIKFKLSEKIFLNFKRKTKDQKSNEIELQNKIKTFLTACKVKNIFKHFDDDEIEKHKSENIKLMNEFYNNNSSDNFKEFHGENNLDIGMVVTMDDGLKYLIPKKSKFFNKKIEDIQKFLPSSQKFDFIVIDPPWTNRYIKRLKKTNRKQSYNMMTDEEISNIPIENHTTKDSIVIVWATNSETHQNAIEQKLLDKWRLKIIAKWTWIKVDRNGELFNSFDGNKKPFEIIYVCSHVDCLHACASIPRNRIIFSHPSSIHSNKPSLLGMRLHFSFKMQIKTKLINADLFSHVFQSKQPKCLEIFARSLHNNFTSIGVEVLKLQNVLLYERIAPTSP